MPIHKYEYQCMKALHSVDFKNLKNILQLLQIQDTSNRIIIFITYLTNFDTSKNYDSQYQCQLVLSAALHFIGRLNLCPVDVIALLHCTRSSLGICASSSGAVAGLLLWKVMLKRCSTFIATVFFRKLAVNQLIAQLAQAVLTR